MSLLFEYRISNRKMKGVRFYLRSILFIGLCCGAFLSFPELRVNDVPQSSVTAFLIPEGKLDETRQAAKNGNCYAAYNMGQHFLFALNQSDNAIYWLRLAAQCPHAEAKAALVYMLLDDTKDAEIDKEIDSLVVELEKIDAVRAQHIREEIAYSRENRRE